MCSGKTSNSERAGRRLGLAVLALVLVGGTATSSLAQTRRESHRIIQLDEEVIEGRIEKPEAFYILQPTNLNYERAEPAESFLPELLRTVEQAPF
jgi:uracil-DNA glycosylase